MRNDFEDNYLMHHGVKGQKWGVKNGPPYPLGDDVLTKKLYSEARKKEPQITKDVTHAVKACGAKMYGIEHKLKTKESIARKISTDSKEKNITPYESAMDIKDAVRYTALSEDNDFVSNYISIKDSLESKGYEEIRCKNYFDLYNQGKVKHKSVQSVFKNPDGYRFEIQFHTPSSQEAKDKKVPIYEERRKPGLSKERQLELEKQMEELAEKVTEPRDIKRIKTH